jgi:hypothetical protein
LHTCGKALVNPQLYDSLVSLGFKDSRETGSLTLDTNLRFDIRLR